MAPAGDAVSVRALTKRYGDLAAVDGVDLDIPLGECFSLLGPNGAGKTTLVEILEGYRRPTSGSVTVLGETPEHADRGWRARIGVVLQSDRDLGDLTVREAVRHFAGYYPHPRDPDEVLDAVGLTDKATSRNETLSGGQRRRLDVALGVIGRPELLFLDEPTTGFDPEARREFWQLIEGLKAEGTTILLTTHYLDEAEHLADRVGVIAAGRIVALGSPEALGGRHDGRARVSWREDGVARSEDTDRPTELVTALAARLGGEIPELAVVRPTLEDTYLELVDGAGDAR
ncbi:MAG: ABC transporter ATP-binding protein [Candidatus Nanopelagicales bacterium]